ncbi:MAG TPA: zf-HC2 domain-containing protein [Gemmatimonadales bacterium]|nr:zf-HC2 domain-containing protein [Gemmatimonadales bacterium]
MRHIPEDELHAYLDQGLSRTQCVEIESHLADCVVCRASRDRIAALRDRTTALLARLAPPLRVPPAFDSVRRRAAEHETARRRRMHVMAWAASLVLAVGAGWTGSSLLTAEREGVAAHPAVRAPAAQPTPVAVSPHAPAASVAAAGPARESAPVKRAAAPARASTPAAPAVAVAGSTAASKDSARAAMLAVLDPAPAVELTQLDPPGQQFDGMWRTMSWDGAQAAAGRQLPHIDGLPVVKVQVQTGDQDSRPVMVVAQQLSSGQVIQTIEGPAAGVSQLLAKRNMADPDGRALTPADSLGRALAGDQAMAMQLGDRMLAITGALPSDSLRAMIRRLNADMRSK